MKRVLSLALAVVMLFTLLPVSALAEEVAAEPAAETEVAEAVQTTVPEEPTEEPAAPSEDAELPAESAEAEQDAEEVPAEQEQPEQAASRVNLAAAESDDIVASGFCGDMLTWTLDSEGTLTISGTGAMKNYSVSTDVPWYSKAASISSVIIENGVTSIGERAFEDCSSLTSVTIGNSVTRIGNSAFYYCRSLESVTIPDSVTSIGEWAFGYCSSLASVTIPDSVTSIGKSAFDGCSSLTSVTIPDSVTSIGSYSFYGCSSLTSVTIGNSVTSIGERTFYNCRSLTEINYNAKAVADLSNNSNVFYNAGTAGDGIKVTFGDNVEKIPAYLFYTSNSSYGPKITSVTIGDNVTSIGKDAFANTVYYNDASKWENGILYLEYCIIKAKADITAADIKAGTRIIARYAFYECRNLTSVTIPDSVTSIGISVFDGCSSLASVTIPNSVKSIESCAFNGCSSLESMTIPNSVTSIGTSAFNNCSSLTSVTIGNSVTSIGTSAFNNCSSLASVTIPDSVTSIGSYSFYGCSSLTSVTIGNSVTSIGERTFYGCSSLTEINYNAKAVADLSYDSNVFYNAGTADDGIKVTFGDSVEKIPARLFAVNDSSYSPKITSVTIGDNVTSIGKSAFDGCSSLTSVTIGNSVTSIGDYAFYNCRSLTEINYNAKAVADLSYDSNVFYNAGTAGDGIKVTFGDSVEKIPANLFYTSNSSYSPKITSVTIGNSVTSIGEDAFYCCSSLEGVYITDLAAWCGITFSDYFSNPLCYAHNLYINGELATDITIPDSVTSIGSYSFYGCSSLTSVTIGNGVTSIGERSFYNCSSLTEINYNAKAVADLTSDSNVFYNAGTAGDGIKVTFGDSVEKIPARLFYTSNSSYSPKITSVTIGDNVTSIGHYAFYECNNLKSVTIGNSVTSIGEEAFFNCRRLTEINYNAKAAADLTSGSDVFYNAGTAGDGIKVTFGKNVKRIPACLFYSTIKVREMVFCGNAPVIGGNAFYSVATTAYYLYGNDTWTSEVMKNYGGRITWKPYSDTEATSVICTGTKYYIVGDKLDTSSISVTINRVDGCVETYNYSTGEIVLGEYDMNKAGNQSIEVTCRGEKTQLDIYVHGIKTETMPVEDYPESSHDYEDNLDKTYTYVADGAHSLDVTFSSETETELNVDYIYVNDTKYTGKELAGANIHIDGDTLAIRLVSDGSDGAYGFSLDNITATYVVHSFTDIVTAPTCTEKGYTTHTCVCGYVYKDSYVDALGHDYSEWTVTTAPTCTEKGVETRNCSRCDAFETREVNALGHNYVDAVCSRCGEKELVTSGRCGDNLTWKLEADGMLTISGTGEMYDGNSRWGDHADKIKSVVIDNGVTSIGEWAFYYCRSLASVTIGNSVTSIGEYAFYSCDSLESVTIPDSVTSIGNEAFRGCSSLASVTIPDSVTSIGSYSFYGCSSLTSVTIPDSVTSIGESAFGGCSSLTSVTIPDSVTSIGEWAFGYCRSLESVTIPDSVTNIDSWAFGYCSSLASVTIPDSVTSIGNSAFYDCSSLASVTIPDSVTSIGSYSFCGCSSLASVTIPDSVTSIGRGAFSGCSSLTSVTIGNGVTSIGEYAFNSCDSLEGVYITDLAAWCGITFSDYSSNPLCYAHNLYINGELATDITIPDSVTSIGSYSFYGCSSLTSVTIPDSVTSIGESAFGGCSSLTSVTIPDSVTSIGSYSFYGCSSLTNVTIPDSVTSIGSYSFYGCSSLTNVTIPDSVTSIGERTFYDCSSLASVTIPDSVTSIGSYSFYGCSSLTSVTIPDSVTSIGDHAFQSCYNIKSVAIYDSVTSIGDYAFYCCYSLMNVSYSGTQEQWNAISIGTDNESLTGAEIYYSHIHDYSKEVTEPTCMSWGYTDYICACGDSYVDSYTNALGHSYKNGKCVRCNAADPKYIAAPTLKITTSAGKPQISWNAVDGATKYWVYRSTDGKNFKYYDSTTKTSYTNKSTSIGTTYYYKVKAVKTVDGTNYTSDLSGAKSILCKPAAPTVSIYRTNGKPQLKWSAVTGATKYWIYRSTDGVNFSYYDSTTKTSYTNSGAASGKKYYYRVKAVAVVNGTNVTSANSNTKSLMTTLAKPTVSITTSNGKPKITWKAVTGADKYYVYRSTDGKNFSYYDSTTKLSYTNTGAKKNTKYYYKVKAICSANTNANSAYSTVVSIKAK